MDADDEALFVLARNRQDLANGVDGIRHPGVLRNTGLAPVSDGSP